MYNTPKPRPQFNGSGGSNGMECILDFDQKQSASSSVVTTTPSTSTSNLSSTPETSSFGTESGYFEEISNMIENSGLGTPQVAGLGGSQLFGKRVGIDNNGSGRSSSSGTSYTLGSSGNESCVQNIFNGKNETSSVNLLNSGDSKQNLNIDGYHLNGVITTINGESNIAVNNRNYHHQMLIPGGGTGVGVVSNIFSSPDAFDCAVASTRSTSDTFTPSVGRDECSPQCSLSDSPGSDPFSISTFRSEQICQDKKTSTNTGTSLVKNTAGANVNGSSTSNANNSIGDSGMGRIIHINKDNNSNSINGDFSAPILNYFNDGLNTDSWGSFMPYTNLMDYCFDSGSTHDNRIIIGGSSVIGPVCSNENNNNSSDSSRWLTNKNINTGSFLPDMTEPGGSKGNVSKTIGGGNGGVTDKIGIPATNGSIIIPNNGVTGVKVMPSDSPVISSSSINNGTTSSLHALRANDIVEKLILDIVNGNRQQDVSANEVFDQVSEILTLALSNLGSKFNRDATSTQNKSQSDTSAQPLQIQNNNWGQNSLGVGGPNFAAPTMLAHPDEFKNPSSFLKIYGDPLCGKSATASGTNNNSTQNSIGVNSSGICTTDSPGSSANLANNGNTPFNNINPTKGQNGNWACFKCSNVNFPRRFRCFKCGEYRDEAGDKIVAEYAKHVYLHHLRAYRSFSNNWVLGSVGATAGTHNNCGFPGSGSSFPSGVNKGSCNPMQISGLGQDYLDENATRHQQQTLFTHGGHRNSFLSNSRSGLKDNNGGTMGISPSGGGISHTSKKNKTFLVATNSQ